MRSYLKRFNATAAAIDKPDPSIVLMAAVSEVTSKINFKVALKMHPPMYLIEFYHEIERYLRQEDAEADNSKVNTVDDEGPSKAGYSKRKANDGFGGSKRQKREHKFSSYIDLVETPKKIYLDTGEQIPYRKAAKREPTDRDKVPGRFCLFHDGWT